LDLRSGKTNGGKSAHQATHAAPHDRAETQASAFESGKNTNVCETAGASASEDEDDPRAAHVTL
jgi:hypothetical protein